MKSLYASEQSVKFDSIFPNPSSLYRDTPFWAWNCELKEEQLRRQIGIFQEMGMGGFHMHARTGLGTPYLSKEFMARVEDCVDEAKKRKMLAWLYDEDRWPSGAAGGLVTRDPKFRARHLELSFTPATSAVDAQNDDSGKLLCCYAVKLDANGRLADYRKISAEEAIPDSYRKLYGYRMVAAPDSWYNDMTYLDTLNPAAVDRFIEVTYDAYFKAVGKEFSHTIPAIFTDEPQFTRKSVLRFASTDQVISLPYTDDLPESYRKEYGCEFFDTLPEVLWELPAGRYSVARYRYHDHVAERFAAAFADRIGKWCEEHNIRFSGHLMDEPSLLSQTSALGEAMRSYRSFQLPGIDMLCDWQEMSTAKQAQSASRQFGRGGVLSELDGVTNWDFPFSGHKGHGDWQAALGITVRVPHLAWVSMAGEAKRDYPASISYQSPWYAKYRLIADHFARVNAALSRGKAVSRIAVIHPVESFWLVYGPQDQTAVAREQAEKNFASLFEWLLFGLLDFDLLSESLLPCQNVHPDGKTLAVGEMRYSTIIVPPTITLRSSTLEKLEAFVAAGGSVIFAGDIATLCDAEPSDRAAKLAERCKKIAYSRAALLDVLEPERELRVVRKADGFPAAELLYQLREEGEQRYLFIANTLRCGNAYAASVQLRGSWQLEWLDSADGSITPIAAEMRNGWSCFDFDFYPHGHLLLRMTPAAESCGKKLCQPILNQEELEKASLLRLSGDRIAVTLDEPNVLVLDRAQWRLNGGEWQPSMEILRLDNAARALMGMRPKSGHIVQPWVRPASDELRGELELRYTINCRAEARELFLAAEQPENSMFVLDGKELSFTDCGYWTDEAIRRSPIPALGVGTHSLIVKRRYKDNTDIERIYLLGDFGVELRAEQAVITEPVRELHWGDVTMQGLPFYGGNILYHTTFSLAKQTKIALRFASRLVNMPGGLCNRQASHECDFAGFRGTLLSVRLDEKEMGDIAFSPYQLSLGTLTAGEHKMELKLFGSRVNCFGPLHLTTHIDWIGPQAWRTEGDLYSDDYRVSPLGVTRSPMLIEE